MFHGTYFYYVFINIILIKYYLPVEVLAIIKGFHKTDTPPFSTSR